MTVNGLNQYDLYSNYNKNNIEHLSETQEPKITEQKGQNTESKSIQNDSSQKPLALNLNEIKPRKNVELEDISLSLKSDGFEMKGKESSLGSLDMEKAVSDMQKDQALMQYQYFVGDSNVICSDEDGTVVQKISPNMA